MLNSCRYNGTLQGLFSYYEKTKSKNPDLLVSPNSKISICEIEKTETPKIYITDGLKLKECIKNYDNLIIYVWSPKCRSKLCYSLNALQQICDFNHIELIIVSEYYDSELMQVNYEIKKPIFGIDTEYYKTNLTSKYLSKFIFDLTLQQNVNGRLLHFKKGVFLKATDSIN